MSAPNSQQPLSLQQFADRFRSEMIPLGNRFCYFCAAVTLSAEDLREYLDEPVAALPPAISSGLPPVQIFLVPYLEKNPDAGGQRKKRSEVLIATERPSDAASSQAESIVSAQDAVLVFAVKDTEVADYHYRFYRAIAEIVASASNGAPAQYTALLREEIEARTHGEVDELSWRLKQDLKANDLADGRPSKRFREYTRQSFVDTLTLYLHGICCDIDVDTGPRQLPSHRLRARLRLLKGLFPPPEGYAVLPEDMK
jgi:hypothetical protein